MNKVNADGNGFVIKLILNTRLSLMVIGFSVVFGCGNPKIVLHPFSENDLPNIGVDARRLDHPPVMLGREIPNYPLIMMEKGIPGEVLLSMTVTKEGKVRDIRVLSSTDASFADAAKEAALRQRYTPATLNGEPVDCRVHSLMTFTDDSQLRQ
jgi:TonB family protein